MIERLKKCFKTVKVSIRQMRFRKLAPDLPYYSATLKEPDASARRQFFSYLMSSLLAVLSISFFSRAASAEKLQKWMEHNGLSAHPDSLQTNDRYKNMLAKHTDVAPINAHNNSGGKHVNVNSAVGHFNSTPPHSNTHMNTPHTNQTTPDQQPAPPKDKTGKEKA